VESVAASLPDMTWKRTDAGNSSPVSYKLRTNLGGNERSTARERAEEEKAEDDEE
jgi:hypothetical protein